MVRHVNFYLRFSCLKNSDPQFASVHEHAKKNSKCENKGLKEKVNCAMLKNFFIEDPWVSQLEMSLDKRYYKQNLTAYRLINAFFKKRLNRSYLDISMNT